MLLGVDVGGTFTDAVLVDGDRITTAKAPTTPDDQSVGVLAAIDTVLAAAGRSPGDVASFAHGMTVATNALLEGKVARTALAATEGFVDVVELGRQARAHLYRLEAAHPAPLVPPGRRVPVPERVAADGEILRPLADPAAVADRVAALDVDAVAVCLLHADRHPEHERALGAALRARMPGVHVSLSHEVVGTFREYERAATTEIDAALSPLLAAYLAQLEAATRERGLPEPEVMQSSGGLTELSTAAAHAAFTVLSGPAGGAAAAALVAASAGEADLLCFDMGGTSCDVCVVEDGRVRETSGREVGGRPLALGMVDVHTVGAGGGSIGWRDAGGALRVGPQSAGARPGPAAYGHGGLEPTVTDAHVVLGHLDGELAGGVRLDVEAARSAVGRLAGELDLGVQETAVGILRVAEAEMLRALRVMTVERGIDPRGFALLAFGGAGPLHATALAEELGIERVLVPQAGSVLSALGLAAAERRRDEAQSVLRPSPELHADTLAALAGDADEVTWELRYRGQAHELALRGVAPTAPALGAALAAAHEERYGYADPEAPWELVTVRRRWRTQGAAVLRQDGQGHDASVTGPTRCTGPEFTALVPEGWAGGRDSVGTLRLERTDVRERQEGSRPSRTSLDPIALQVATGALRSACEEMGATLIRAAHSPNIKERHDCSTALFDPGGECVMQAEHIPVHLGSMPFAVAAVLDREHAPGVSWILNDPYAGGTHLPDITVITPAFTEAGELLGFAAARAHHADVGAEVPGSMPADSTRLEQEGVIIAPRILDATAMEELTARMRQPAERRADLRAQLAATRLGVARLRALADRLGVDGLREATAGVLDYTERRTRAALAGLPDGVHTAEDVLEATEGDVRLLLTATVRGEEVTLDFRGSAGLDGGNLNCPRAVTVSAAVFAMRVLTDPDVPPSAGAHRPVTVLTEPGTLLDACAPAAVAAGNVETSSRVADLVLRAFGRALGQGTMNNLTLAGEAFSYYETVGGGQGASRNAPGPSGVHVAMSNTRNTPVEALELELPLRVVEYAVRRGSGGAGAHRGGDGVVRELEALAPMTYSLITERRTHAPAGAEGGADGATGRNLIDGEPVPAKATGELRAGQRIRLETPGGGGHGPAA